MVETILDIPNGFFDEEERCGFQVTKERKKIWAIELDLLMQLDKVCKENGLKYCVGAGTLLGTIRHHGFIPWDDDVDVYMLRPDYNKLMKLVDHFHEPYFLQNIFTEKKQIKAFARLRNSRTTGATLREVNFDICKGIFIDIFPLDGVVEKKRVNDLQQKLNNITMYFYRIYNYANKRAADESDVKRIIKLMIKSIMRFPHFIYNCYEKNLSRYSVTGTQIWGNRTLVFNCPKSRRPLEDYTDLITMPFEFINVPVSRNYDEMLRQQYGDYMKLPENKFANNHGELIVSTDRALTDAELKTIFTERKQRGMKK